MSVLNQVTSKSTDVTAFTWTNEIKHCHLVTTQVNSNKNVVSIFTDERNAANVG